MLQDLIYQKKGIHKMYTLTKGGKQELIFIDEPNLYRVIFRSNKKEAVEFQNWVFEQVLPTIRKTGAYSLKITPQQKSQILKAVNKKVSETGRTHQSVWTSIHDRFQVNSYHELLASQFDEVMQFLNFSPTPPKIADLTNPNIKTAVTHITWVCAWYFKYSAALRVLMPKSVGTIHDHFKDMLLASELISKKAGIKKISIEQLEYFPWDGDFYQKSEYLKSL